MAESTRIHDDPIELWRSLAQFSPRVLPRPRLSDRTSTVKDYLSGHHLPWEPVTGHMSHHRDRVWRHVLFGGLISYRRLLSFAGLSSGTTSAPDRVTALFAVRVGQDGQLLPESLELSRAGWAAAALARRPEVPALFADASRQWRDGVVGLLRERHVRLRGTRYPRTTTDAGRGHDLDRGDCVEMVRYTVSRLGLEELFPDRPQNLPVRVSSTLGPPSQPVGDDSLLNHPTAEDLDLATDTTRFRQAAAALLGIDAAESFEDVEDSRAALYYGLAPQTVPEGTFRTSRPTVATQFAINAALGELADSEGIWCCPRSTAAGSPDPSWADDLLAGLVTRRAVAMANIPDPAELFDPEGLEWSSSRQVHLPHPDLADFEIIRSSPVLEDVAPRASGSVLRPRNAPTPLGPVTSPIRVRLLPGMEDSEPYRGLSSDRDVDAVHAIDSVLNTLGHDSSGLEPVDYDLWDETAETVLSRVEKVRSLLRERQRYHEVVPMLLRNEDVVADIAEALAESSSGIAEKESELARLTAVHDQARERSMRFSDAIAAHLRDEPSVLSRLATFGRVRFPWRDRLAELRGLQSDAQAEEQDAQTTVDRVHRELRQLRAAHEALRDDLRENKASALSLRDELARYPYPEQAIDQEWLAGDWQEEGALAPWLDDEIQQARSEAFQAALRLHSTAIRTLPAEYRAGLLAARDLLSGHPSDDPDAVLAAWQVLCLVFPQVSVEAEFLPGLCRSLGENRLGWIVYSDAARLRPGIAYAGLLHAHRATLSSSGEKVPSPGSGVPDDVSPAFASAYMVPPDDVQASLATASSCSLAWAPARTSAYDLALAVSKYSD